MSGAPGSVMRFGVLLLMVGIFAFLFGDAVGDPTIGALFGVLAFVSMLPVLALAEDRTSTR